MNAALGTSAAPLNTSWYITGLDSGRMGSVVFADVEHLLGGDDNEDEFIFSETGKTSGSVEGGARGFDTVVLDGGAFKTVTFSAVNGSDGTIKRDSDVLRYTGMEPLIDNTDAANRVIEASEHKDEIKVSRPSAGKIKVESVNSGGPTFESIEFDDPTASLTIKGMGDSILPSGSDTVTIEGLGAFAADLIIETGSLSRMLDNQDSITFKGDVDLQGKKLEATAETITINDGVTVKTSLAGGAAGNITLNSWHTTISTNAKLLAEGTTAGNITINAIDDTAIFTPLLNIDIKDVGVTIKTGVEIKGHDIKITATADSRHIFDISNFDVFDPSTYGTKVADLGLGILEGLTQIVAAVSVAQSDATIDVATGSTIVATGNFEARATSYASPTASPLLQDTIGKAIGFPLPALSLGIALTDATVTLGGELSATGNVILSAKVDHNVNTSSDAGAVKGIAPAGALSIIDSDATAQVTDDAKLTVGGNLFVESKTIDRVRTMARSTAGKDGDVAISAAVTIENGHTNAFLDGTVTVTGTVGVTASQHTELLDGKKIFLIPTFLGGTSASAGVGTDSTGDLLDDTKAKIISDGVAGGKAGLSKFATWVKEKYSGKKSEELQKDNTVTKDNVRTWDAAAAVAVVVDTNLTLARIGDGGADLDANYGKVSATGPVTVQASVKMRPDISAASSAATNPDAGEADPATKFGGSLAVAVGVYTNEAVAQISEQAWVSSAGELRVDAKTLNEIDPLGLWGVNLISPFFTSANYDTTQASQFVSNGEIVEVKSGHTAGGETGSWYKFIGTTAQTINLGTEDYTNESNWQELGNPTKHILLDKWLPTATTYLNDNLGLDNNLVDTWSQATAGGQKLAIAGAVTVIDFDQTAEALIKAGAQINQPEVGPGPGTTNGSQSVIVEAASTSHLVNFGGNIKLPGISGSKNAYEFNFQKPGLGVSSGDKGSAAGATVMVFDLDNTVTARIEDGVTLTADSLQMTADTFVVNVSVGASGGSSDDIGLNGAFIVSLVNNTTIAHIENGATIAIGSKAVADGGGSGASVFVDAHDKSYVVNLVGGVATSEHVGVGLSAGVSDITRNTEAVIGNLHSASTADIRGTFTALGDVRLNARNEGFLGTVVVAGSSVSQKSEDPTAKSGSTGLKKSDGSTTDDPGKWPNNQKNYDSVIAELKQKQLGGAAPGGGESVGTQQGKAGIAISGAASVTIVDDNARAYIHEAGVLTATGKAVALAAANDTHVGSLAGGIAFSGDRSSATTQVAIAGAFGINYAHGTTEAFLDDVTSVSSKTLSIEADRSGYIVSLTAGVSGATGRKGIAVGGSVAVTLTDYTTEAGLSSTTGTIAGNVTIQATDDTNIILVAGSAGFGGKAGIGAAIAFAEIGNTTRATIDSVTDLKHTGALSLIATADGDIIAVTGSAGVGSGESSKLGLAGTLTINRIANIVEAQILNSTFHKDSTGDITIRATDNSFIFSFAGAFGASKSVGLGVAAAVNLLDNDVRAKVDQSTLRSSGGFTAEAGQTGTLVSVAVGVGSGQQFAGAGSITVNQLDNTIEATVSNGSDIKVDGAIDISAADKSTSVTVSGGVAIGKTAAVGAAFSVNLLHNTLAARIDDSLVESTQSTAGLEAEARATLVSVAIGGAGGQTFALGGSIAVNQVENTVEASVTDKNGAAGKASLLKAKNDIAIAASDDTTLVVVAGGLAFASSAAIGVTFSTTQVQNKIHAFVDGSEVTSTDGAVSLTAGFKPPDTDADLTAISLGTSGVPLPESAGSQVVNVAFGVAGSSTFAGGGAFSLNWIRNDVQAYVANGAKVQASGDVTLAARDEAEIDSFAVGGAGSSSFAAGIGLSYNYIGGDPGNPSRDIPADPSSANVGKAIATVNASTVTSTAGNVTVLASQQPKIINATIAGAVSGTAAGGGAFSINFIRSIADAAVIGGSTVSAKQDIKVAANAVPVMITIAGNVSIGGTAGFGVASATNDMQSQITARIDGSKARATDGNILVDASIGKPGVLPTLDTDVPVDAQIWTFAVAGAGAGNVALAGSLSLNWIRNVVEARISNIGDLDPLGDEISAGGKIAVTASDASTINAIAGAISVALSAGSGAAGASVAYNYLGGDPSSPGTTDNNRVKAVIENVTGTLKAGSIEVKAGYSGEINNITLGAAGAQNFALGGSVSINKIRNTADAHISGSTGVSTTTGNVTIEANDTSRIRALAGGVGIAIAAGGGIAGAVGISVGDNLIENTTKAYIDGSTVTSAAGMALTANSKQTIQSLTIGGAVAGSAGDGIAFSAAGAGSGNTVRNQVLAYVTNSGGANEVKASAGSILLTAKDESTIQAASGGVAISIAAGSFGSVGASIGISASDNDIDNTVKAYIDNSKVTAVGANIELKATENATIEAFALGGALAGAGGGLIGGGAFGAAGAGAGNTIDNTVQAYIGNSSVVTTTTSGAVTLTASDTSKIKIDSGGIAIALSGGGVGGASVSIGASVAQNDITNTIQAYVDSATVTSAGAVELEATSTPTIDALSFAGAVAAAGGAGGGLAASGAGASSTNTIANTVEAYAKTATITSQNGGAVKFTASETAGITAHTVGGSVAFAAGAAAGTISIGVSLADNDVHSAIRAYSDRSTITSAGALDLKASSSATAESLSVAVSVAVSGAPAGAAFAGGGANSTSRVHNTVEAYAKGLSAASRSTIIAAGPITISASETSTLKADVGAGSIAVGLVGASVGVSIAKNTADSTINAYVDNVNLTSTAGNIEIGATATDTISKTLGVATSVAIAIGGAGAGAESTATAAPTVETYVGSGATLNAGLDVKLSAKSTASVDAETYGVAVGAVAIGGSVANATANGSIKAHVDGTIASSRSVDISANAVHTANARATALGGGILAGVGADATATVSPTVKAYAPGVIVASNGVSLAATATPQALSSAIGVAVGLYSAGASVATSLSSPTIEAQAGGTSATITSGSLSVAAALVVPAGGYTAKSHAIGATGGLIGINATVSKATTSGTVYGSVADGTTLVVRDSVSITATGDSKQQSDADSLNIGLIAAGGNVSTATASIDTRAFMGREVTMSNGTDIGGLTDGGRYYVVLDDTRPFTAANVSAGDNTIDLGADHGLQTYTFAGGVGAGDRVIFRAGTSPITGLESLETYAVALVSGTNRIRLHHINADGSVGGVVDIGSAAAGKFSLVDPRRVRLSDTSEGALAATPAVIDLDAATATGATHQLTPLTGFTASALEFNPTTQANSAKNTIELPSGHKLLTGQAVSYGRSGGAALTITATGTDYSHAISESGSGGVVAGSAASATTKGTSGARAYIDDDTDGDANKTSLRASKIAIAASHTSRFDSELSTIQASLLGYSGAWAGNDINTTVEARIGASADIQTQDLQVTAVNTTRKDIVSGNNVKSGSGGVFQGNNAESVTTIENRTRAMIGDNATVKVTGNVRAPGNFLLSAFNDHEGDDEVLLDTGGAIVGSGVTSHIKVNVNEATASIGKSATIETVGALDLETRARGVLSTHPTAHTYGLAGGAGVDSEVKIHNTNQVSIGEKTTVQALGDINLLAGRGRDGSRNFFKLRSEGDDLNATVVPISTLRSHVDLQQDHTVVVGSEAVVKTARDANLLAETLSTADIVAFGSGKNWLTAVAGGIDSLLGGGMSEEEKGGTVDHTKTLAVTVDGTVEVGILKDQKLTIAKGDATSETTLIKITENVGGIGVTTTIESLANNLVIERQRLINLIAEYKGDFESVAAYTAALQDVERQMDELGLSTTATAPDGTVTKFFIDSYNVPYVTVDPIWAQSGTIRISGDSVLGTGKLLAPGDVNVTITNSSPAYLRIKGITIPDNAGGRVRFNGEDVKSIAGFGGTITATSDAKAPNITIVSTFNEDFPENQDDPDDPDDPWHLFRTPDIEIAGDIDNVAGKVTIASEGSVISRANIIAGTLKITAGKNFVLTSKDALFNVGGSPASASGPWNTTQTTAENFAKAGGTAITASATDGVASGAAIPNLGSLVAAALTAANPSNVVAANNVVIVAQSLNVNGILQSGIADYNVSIPSSFASKITAAESARSLFLSGNVGTAAFVASLNGIQADEGYTYFRLTGPTLITDDSGLEYSKTGAGNNIPVFYNAATDKLEVSGVRVQGGFMSLTGRILNTSKAAEIRVMDGYGRINIDNKLDVPLVINRLDTSAGIEGKLIITDSGEKNAQGAPRVTEYTRVGSDIQKKSYFFVTPGNEPQNPSFESKAGTRQWEYTPESAGYRFYWTTGNDLTRKTITTYGTSAWLGIDALAADPGNIVEGPTVTYANPRALLTGSYIQSGGSADYTYEFERINTTTEQKEILDKWSTSTWYGTTTYYTKELKWQGQKDINTHSVRADRPIAINFIGYDAGAAAATVTTAGHLLINGEIQNAQGTTTLTSGRTITLINDSISVGGRDISLNATNGSIGADAPIRTNLTNGGGGSLSAAAASVVRIQEITGDLTVNLVSVSPSGDRVELTAAGSILGKAGNPVHVQGGLVVLNAGGAVGSLGAGTARLPGAGAIAINVNTGVTDRDTLTVRAHGDVYVRETAGDLRLVSVDTTDTATGLPSGDVRVEVAAGRLMDANTIEVKDPRTELQLLAVWDRMNATESTAHVSTESTVRAFENLRTREYQAYWTYRASQPDEGATFDPTFHVTLSSGERAAYEEYYAGQGLTDEEIEDAITTLENGRTQEYRELHKTYGKLGDGFDTGYRYGTAATQSFGGTAVDADDDSVTLKGHAFDTGDAVVYHSGGGTITGLVDGTTYYAVVDAATPGVFQLASARADALAATPTVIDLSGAVAGSAHVFSAADLSFGQAAVDEADNTIDLARHAFLTGQAVVYHSRGGSIAGLTDNQTYYVVVSSTDPSQLQLATSHGNATASTPVVVDVGAVSGDGFFFSEADVLVQKAAWSDTQLKNSFSSKVLGPKGTSGTTATKEAPNVIGNDIALQVSSDVGSIEASIDIVLPLDAKGLDDKQKLALAGAERSDVTFYADAAGTIEIDDPRDTSQTVSLIRIIPKADVDVTAFGVLTVSGGATVNVGSEENISIDTVAAAQATRITGQKALINANLSAVNVATGDLILEAEDNGIGSSGNALVIDLHPGATLVARAHDGIYIREHAGDLNILEVTSTDGHVDLRAERSILDADDDDLRPSGPDWNILADSVYLEAGTNNDNTLGSIGTSAAYLEIDVQGNGTTRAIADAGVWLHEVGGDMNVDLVRANAGDVGLRAAASILDFKNDVVPDVVGNNITLRADIGSLGAPANDLDLDSAFQAAGSVTAHSAANAHLTEPNGNLSLNTVQVDAGTAFIKALVGSILDGNPDPSGANVLSGKVFLFASQDIGQSGKAITSKAGNLEAESTKGTTWITNLGSLVVGGVTGAPGDPGMKAGGDINLGATSPITVTEHQIADGAIVVTSTDDANDADPNGLATPGDKSDDADFLIVKSGVTVRSNTSSVTLLAGDDLTIEAGATIQAATALTLRGNFGNVDKKGTTITLNGHLSAPLVDVYGSDEGDTIVLHPEALVGHTKVSGLGGADLIVVDRLPSVTTMRDRVGADDDGLAFAVRDTIDLDGGGATDTYVVNITGGGTDYIINVNDTGAAGDADTLTINATADNDLFLVREHFVAYLVPQTPLAAVEPPSTVRPEVERINYNGTIDGRLIVNALGGDDHFYVDDNSTLTTLDGGSGEDFFQVGQVFGTDRIAPAVAPGDEIETVFTTVGWLSRGVSHETLALGGTGNDTFQVYSNQAEVRLEGNEDDDTFTVRSFALADEVTGEVLTGQSMGAIGTAVGGDGNDVIQYNVNALLDVDGGSGLDQFILLGTEFSDNFVVASDGLFGAGQNIAIANLELITVDGLEGNDHFFIFGTPVGVAVTAIGGIGWDTFDVSGDVTLPIVSSGFGDADVFGSHVARSDIQGPLMIDGGVGEVDRRLRRAVILPTETDPGVTNPDAPTDDTGSIDTLNIFNDGSGAAETATLTATNFRIDGMAGDLTLQGGGPAMQFAGGITYGNVETLEILLGSGTDTLTIEDTMSAPDGVRGPLTIVHGGGGSDQITVNGGGGAASPLIVFGDTSQDGARYAGTPGVASVNAFGFTNPGDDVIDARGADGGVAIYGGRGGDTIWGSNAGDQIAGGSGDDTINSGPGDDLVYGDSGFNLFRDTVTIPEPNLDSGVIDREIYFRRLTTIAAPNLAAPAWADTLAAGGDVINAGEGNNVVVGDLGLVTQGIIDNLFDTSGVVAVETTSPADGGIDTLVAADGNNTLLGGSGADTIVAGAGNNIVAGDNARVDRPADAVSLIETTDAALGGVDVINVGSGNNVVFGGAAGDVVATGDGHNIVFGDDGLVDYDAVGRLTLITSTSPAAFGGADTITTGAGQDLVLGGRFGDTINAGAGNNVVFGDGGRLVPDPTSVVEPWAGHPLRIGTIETIDPADGGDDIITTLGGRDLILGGNGGDVIESGDGQDTVAGDLARVVYQNGIATLIETTDTSIGGADTVRAAGGDDIVIGGRADDALDGGSGRDLIFGDSVMLNRASTLGDVTNPRFRALTGTQIYSVDPATAGQLLINTSTDYADPRGAAWWADFQITLLHHAADTAATFYGADYIAGGAGDDTIFGQLGNDVIQGDGSIDFVSNGGRVGAFRDATNVLHLNPSFDDAADGHDYIEGGGGGDVIVGNGGQDDIIGGSSVLFSLVAPSQRPDGADIIFGGSGTKAARNDAGDGTAQGHASDADAIIGDNGNIFRLVGVNAAPGGGGGVGTFGGFLAFNYDNYTNSLPVGQQVKIVARGISLLDYTPGGPDYLGQPGPLVVGNIGAADEIHGEAGDDVVYAGAGSDVLFGDGQDDDLIGGYGLDWISGGTGDDGILGDDGRIVASRNGTAEPLNGLAVATVQSTITNSNGQIAATINVTGTLAKRVDLTPFFLDPNAASQDTLFRPIHADDIIFGGLGNDFIHAGSGDDAVSGAEALGESYIVVGSGLVRSDFSRPFNPGDALHYNPATTLFGQHDPNNPMRRILLNANGTLSTNGTGAQFFLNFDPAEGPLANGSPTIHTDGADAIFGDLGNDWIVGGTGQDHIFAGWGDDVINADDDHSTAGGLNNAPDAQASYADIAYGGAGRDVLIANTSNDVLVDNTEFNSFLVPFSKNGPPTVNRALNPALEQFLYSLSAADGADFTLAAPGVPGSGPASRNGEPYGELGLVTQADAAWGDQHGGPRDPQAGNTSGSGSDPLTGGKKAAKTAAPATAAEPTTAATDTTAALAMTTATGTASTETLALAAQATTSAATSTQTASAPVVAPTSALVTSSTAIAPSIDWQGSPSKVTLLPWAQGLSAQRPVGLSLPQFDLGDDDDDLIDWKSGKQDSHTPALSASGRK